MTKAMAKHLNPPKIRVFSAGVQSSRIRPEVYNVMAEIGLAYRDNRASR